MRLKNVERSKSDNQLITNWLKNDKDIKFHVDKLIENTKAEFELQESNRRARPMMELDFSYSKKGIEEVIGLAAAQIAKAIDANCVVSFERKPGSIEDRDHFNVQVSIFKRLESNGYEKSDYTTKMRRLSAGSIIPIKELLIEAINKRYINKGDRVVCVEDESLGSGYKGTLLIFDVDKIFFNIGAHKLAENIHSDVLESVINIALEISKEGREGRRVGTAFVVGPAREIVKHTKQMIINPFVGYPEEHKQINDPNIKETIKEFAQLDGAFVIDETGTVITAGAYLTSDASGIDMPGYGTRHRSCAALTKEIDALAVVVSESGGRISLFKKGKLVMRLP